MAGDEQEDSGYESRQLAVARQPRERSQIEFPYSDLGHAEELTRTLYVRGGGTAEPNQLAGWMDQSATGGSFRSRLSAARLFGFVETERGAVTITALGRDVIDEDKSAATRVTAFLRVPLFAQMYEKHQGYSLPPSAAIEKQMVELGVAKKQKDRARQVFQKSAQLARFVDPTTGRFIKPSVRDAQIVENGEDTAQESEGEPGRAAPEISFHPFIEGLLRTLPETGAEWPHKDRVKWLRLATNAFDLIYQGEGAISIRVAQQEENGDP